jgi:hypothetical protein
MSTLAELEEERAAAGAAYANAITVGWRVAPARF